MSLQSNDDGYIESGVNFKTVKTQDSSKRKFSASIGTINRSYTIERGKERRPALTKMFSTGSLETSSQSLKSSGIAASPLLQNVNVNSNNSNSNLLVPCRAGSMVNLGQYNQGKLDVHPFAWPLEHSSSLPVISKISEEDDEIYSTPSANSLSQSNKSELLHKLSPFSSFSNLDLHSTPRKDCLRKDKANAVISRLDGSLGQNLKSQLPKLYQNCLLASSTSLPSLATNQAINTDSDIINTNKQHTIEVGTNKAFTETGQLLPTEKLMQTTLSVPPPLPPRKHLPTTYNSTTLLLNRPRKSNKSALSSTISSKQQSLKQHDDGEASDSIGQMPNCNSGTTKLRRRRSISLSDLRSSLEKKSLKLTSMCNVETLRKATVMKIPSSKSRQTPHQKLIKQPADYQNVSVKELMAIRAAVTSPSFALQSSTGSNAVTIRPKPPDNASKPPIVPKRHSSLFMSSSSDEEIILQYKRMSSNSYNDCQDVKMALDSSKCDTGLKHCDATASNDVFYTLADQRATEPARRQDVVHPVTLKHLHNVMHHNPDHDIFTYDHLDFSRSTATDNIFNTAVTKIDGQSESTQETVLDQSLENPVVSQDELFSSSSSHWLLPSTDGHYNRTIHFDQKELKQGTFNKPYDTLQDVIKLQYSTPRPKAAALKEPSCSHIYEDISFDYEDIDDDDEDYVIMKCNTTSVPPPPPLLSPAYENADVSKIWQQQVTHSNTKHNIVTNRRLVSTSSVVESSEKSTSKAASPVEPQIKIMVGKTIKGGQPLNFQDKLNKIQAKTPETHKQLESQHDKVASSTIENCQTSYCHNSGTDGENVKSSELEAKFLAMKSTDSVRKQMIEKTESKLATKNNTNKRIELHNYTNMTKKFMILREENSL